MNGLNYILGSSPEVFHRLPYRLAAGLHKQEVIMLSI